MDALNNMKLGTKLKGGFLVVVAVLVGMALLSNTSMGSLNQANKGLLEGRLVPGQLLGQAQAEAGQIPGEIYKMASSPDAASSVEREISDRIAAVEKDLSDYRKTATGTEEERGLEAFDRSWESYKREVSGATAQIKDGKAQTALQSLRDGGGCAAAAASVAASLAGLSDTNARLAQEAAADSAKTFEAASRNNLLITALAVALSLFIAFALSGSIIAPLDGCVDMVQEMAKGRLGKRMKTNRVDEIGSMSRALDELAEDLSLQSATAEAVAAGDLSVKIQVRSENDSTAKSLAKVIEVLQGLQKEVQRLTDASKEGQLGERGKAGQFKGAYAEIVGGVNQMLDAILLPIGEGNRILAQISGGKIDELIAQTYKGDHEKMKQAVNNVAVTVQGLQKELQRLNDASKDGRLNERGKADQFKGAYADIIGGVNQMLDAILLPIGEGNRILAQISGGKIDELIAQTYKGDHEKMKQAVNNVAVTIQSLQKELNRLVAASKDGQLSDRGKADQFKGAYAEVIVGVNQMLDAILLPIGEGNRVLAQISDGKIDELIAQTYKGDHEKMKQAVNNVAVTVQTLQKELARLVDASKDGQLSDRGKPEQFKGAYADVVRGVNQMLDAILLPIGEGNRILAQVAGGKIDELIAQTYKGDHEKMKQAVNSVAVTVQGLQKELQRLTDASRDGLLSERGKPEQFKGAYADVVRGVNEMLDAILLPIGEGNRILAQISVGKVDELVAQTYKGDHEKMKQAVNNVGQALQALVADAGMLAKAAVDGRLETRADASKHLGDFKRIVQGVNETLDSVLGPINEAALVLDKVAAKDLTARVKGDYKGGHAKIKDAINLAVENLDKSLQQVAIGADQVASATAQIGAGSQSLAQGSSEQASSIEEVSSSLQEMGSMTRQSATNAKEAKAVAEQAKTAADKGVASMNLMSEAINKIKDSSDATAKIVKTIDEIAFQTNLLALNAAVEAARAGEAGKGFAVVAEEVRNLAMRSAEAAKNTANLIEGAVKNAENGVNLNQQVLVNFKEINERSNKVAEVVAEIAAASEQQDTGITQVNKAVEQMSQVTQQNAANAEESSSAAEQLSSQSEEMRSMVAGFTITGGAEAQAAGRNASHNGHKGNGNHNGHKAGEAAVRQLVGIGSHNGAKDAKSMLPLDEKDHQILKGF